MDDSKRQFLEERQIGIGGSDSPALLGIDPWKNKLDVYNAKIGPVQENEQTPPMQRGTFLEPYIRFQAAVKTGYEIKEEPMSGDLTDPYMICHTDGIVKKNGSPNDGVFEAKCPGLAVFSTIKREGIPDYYQAQMNHNMGVTNRSWGLFAIFNAELWQLLTFEVKRDDELIGTIYDVGRYFWHNHVIPQIPPVVDPKPEVELPPIGGEMVKIDDDPEFAQAVEDYRLASEICDEAQSLKDGAKTHLQAIMAEKKADVVEGYNLRIYWKSQEGRTTYDYKRMKADGIDISKYAKTGKGFRSFRTYDLTPK